MNGPMYVMPPQLTGAIQVQAAVPSGMTDVLRQMLAVQQEQLALFKSHFAKPDSISRGQALLARWRDEFPDIGEACKQAMPALERALMSMIRELTERIATEGDALDDYELTELLDRYGMRFGQMGNIMSQLGLLAEASQGGEGVSG